MKTLSALAIILAGLFIISASHATQPLFDRITITGKSGNFFPEKCCWVPLPKTEKLIQARLAEQCSAIGGPVGQFNVSDGKLWLTELSKCSGPVPLKDIYPELPDPAPATWLSGTFTAYTDYQCISEGFQPLFRTKTVLIVKEGVILSMTSEGIDSSKCRRAP